RSPPHHQLPVHRLCCNTTTCVINSTVHYYFYLLDIMIAKCAILGLIAAGMVGLSMSFPERIKRDSTPEEYELPSNATAVLTRALRTGFRCDNRVYGYYADIDNNCEVFHICYPYVDVDLAIRMRMFSFICGSGLVFDQEKMVCERKEDAIPCEASNQFYDYNNYFGQVEVQFRDGEPPATQARDFQVQTAAELGQNFV
ncbi:unnamed protein product, partial [Meganyctiphanes norvegica]